MLPNQSRFFNKCISRFQRYLQEIGYIDKVVELRSARVKMLLGLNTEEVNGPLAESVDVKPFTQIQSQQRVLSSRANDQQGQSRFEETEEESVAPKEEQSAPKRSRSPPMIK